MEPYRLPQGIEERLQARARVTGRSVAEVAREAVLDEIEAIEDYYHAVALVRQQRRARSGGPSRQ
jgi:predicted DNA-binding protein